MRLASPPDDGTLGRVQLPDLGSTFGDRIAQPDRSAELRAALDGIEPGQFEAWVTHQVNITALTGAAPRMGEAVVVGRGGTIAARLFLA